LQKELGGNLASRGMLNTGVESQMRNQLGQAAQQDIGKAAGNIATQRQRDLDQMTMAGTGLMRAPGEMALGQQQLGLQQYGMQQSGELARAGLQQQGEIARMQQAMEHQRLAMQQQQMAANLWGTYMNMFR
jgi:hypothetical protein